MIKRDPPHIDRLTLNVLWITQQLVIKSWGNRGTQRFAEEGKSRFRGLDEAIARRRLRLLDEADRLEDLTALKSVGLHRLQGDRRGQWAISAGGPWRITFEFRGGDAWNVEIVEHHWGEKAHADCPHASTSRGRSTPG